MNPLRILLLAHAFNGLTQRLFVELRARGHQVSVELDIADAVTEEAIALFDPDVVLAPFLKRRIPESVWSRRVCLVVHPGPPGDRGPSALDWAVLRGEREWGVTVLQAVAEFDAGPVWAHRMFAVRSGATKASLYRHEVTAAAVDAVQEALERVGSRLRQPSKVPATVAPGDEARPRAPAAATAAARGWQPLLTAEQRTIDWSTMDAATVLARVRSADGFPGAPARLFGQACRLFDAHSASRAVLAAATAAPPGTAVARRGPALLVRCKDGAVWIGHVRRSGDEREVAASAPSLKLPATRAFDAEAAALPELAAPLWREVGSEADDGSAAGDDAEWDELCYREFGPEGTRVGWLDFDFHNGALSQRQAARLLEAISFARSRPTRGLVFAGGRDFFSNGIHLHEIEDSAHDDDDSAADASMRHIEAIDDIALAIVTLTDRVTIAALRGNAGAGGCFLALAADQVWARDGVVLNPHYKNMGNLYGSEYWTYLLPRRIGADAARALMRERLPLGAAQAAERGLVDLVFGRDVGAFEAGVRERALALAASPQQATTVAAKAAARAADEAVKPLAAYREEELAQMRRNFYGFDPSYHVARHHFVHRKPHAWTPRHLAIHR